MLVNFRNYSAYYKIEIMYLYGIFHKELWYWRRLFRIPWTSRRSNPSILKEINAEYSLEVLNAEAEASILWPLVVKSILIGKDPDAGKD